jgi:hypothetical protein
MMASVLRSAAGPGVDDGKDAKMPRRIANKYLGSRPTPQ